MRCAVACGGTPAGPVSWAGSRSRAIHNRVNHLRGRSTLFPLPAVGGQTSHFADVERCAAGGTEPRVTVGGRRRRRGSAPDPAHHPACRGSGAGLLQEDARFSAGLWGNSLHAQPRASSCFWGAAARAQLAGVWVLTSPPPSTPLARARRGPRSRRPGPARRTCPGAKSFHAGQTLRSVTSYGLDPFTNFVSLFAHI